MHGAAEPHERLTAIMSGEDRSPGAALGRVGLSLLVPAYALATAAHRFAYELGICRRVALARPVLSVGNLTAGGTGKTPMVAWLAARARENGHRVAVLLRGYKGRRDHDGVHGDEGELLRRSLPDVLVLEGSDRAASGVRAIAEGCDRLILDDGLQHHRLARDVNVVTVDAMRPFGFGHLLPRGLLRERPAALARASAIILTRCEHVAAETVHELEQQIDACSGGKPRARSYHEPIALRRLETGEMLPCATIRGARVVAFCGIGHPEAFLRTLAGLGVDLVDQVRFADHQHYGPAQLETIAAAARTTGADYLITTEKDAVKLKDVRMMIPLVSVVIEMRLDQVPAPIDEFVR